jgi:hypothetical protein
MQNYQDNIDIFVSIGSLQEMSQSWVDRYMSMLSLSEAKHFYSLNYGAQPLGLLNETRNWWSSHPGSDWTARIIDADVPIIRLLTHQREFAEHLYFRRPSSRKASDWRQYRDRVLSRQVQLECFDCLRHDSGDFSETADFVEAIVATVPEEDTNLLPKELVGLAQIAGQSRPEFKKIIDRLLAAAGNIAE